MKTVSINLYSFNELNKQAQAKAINDHENFLTSVPTTVEDENGKLEDVYRDDYSIDEIIESIEINDYLFFYDGQIAHCTTYTGKHEKAGITEFYFHGITYTLPMGEGSLR